MAVFTCCWFMDLLITLLTGLLAIYAYFRYQFGHWHRRGIPTPLTPQFPYGNFRGLKTRKMMDLILADIYRQTPNEKIVGCYLLAKPVILLRDVEMIKNVLVKNFSNFHNRLDVEMDLKREPLGAHVFFMHGQAWRNVRTKLTPIFTLGKMKAMFPVLNEIGKKLSRVFETASGGEIDLKDTLTRYSTDIISSAAFGFQSDSLKDPQAIFQTMAHEMTNGGLVQTLMTVLFFTWPELAVKLPISLVPKHVSKFFLDIARDTIEHRSKYRIHRNDFMQPLVQLATQGYVKDADNPEIREEDQQKFTIQEAAAQAFLFFFAGYETSSSTMLFALYELALNPELQKKVQDEIDQAREANGGELTYDGVMHADLLDRVVSETLRKYPVAGFLLRECNQEFPIPDSDSKLKPGDAVWISIYGLHHDMQFYPNPDVFDPDRFLPEIKETRPHFTYMPFGEGPRNCIGNRFALMQIKIGIASILSKHSVVPSKRTQIPVNFDPKAEFIVPKGKMYIKVETRR